MGELRDYIEKLKTITVEVQERKLLDILHARENQLIDLNTGQLFKGGDAQGRMLESYHESSYAQFKLTLNPAGVTDLKLTGSFYDKFVINTSKFPVEFTSMDTKSPKLQEHYGDIFGLDEKSKSEFTQDILEDVREAYRAMLSV